MTHDKIQAVHKLIDERKNSYLDTLKELVAQPSVSANDHGVKECARLLKNMMLDFNIDAEIIPTAGQPVVFGQIMRDPDSYTLLCYGHYDVQPPEPLQLWKSPPFEPQVRDNRLFGRGTGDNKGQLIAHVLAAHSWLEVTEQLPINLKFVFEGEEESGSPNLADFVQNNKQKLECDLVYISDGGVHPSGNPTISLGNRGIVGISLIAEGADRDNHSGNKGGVAPNPVFNLAHFLSNTVSPSGEVKIDGFYDDVRPITDKEEDLISNLPFDPYEVGSTMGLDKVDMDASEYYKRIMLKPYFNVSGFSSGYVGDGSKTIIPGRAECRIDIRLVADQSTEDIVKKLKDHAERIASDIQVHCGQMGSMEPSRTSPDHPAIPVIERAVQEIHSTKPYILPSGGGSLPNAVWPNILGVPHVGVPYANADEHNHSPNENLHLDYFHRGIHTTAQLIHELKEAFEQKQ